MFTRSLGVAAALVSAASAYTCTNLTVPVSLSARNGRFNLAATQNNIEVTNFILNNTQQGANYTAQVLAEYATVSGDYELAATYCVPGGKHGHDHGPKALQVLTHGIGFDRSYWDLPFNAGNYSYTAVATDRYGYATLSWDRLGIGMSSHGDPVQEIQAWLEVDALRALTEAARHGSLEGVPKYEKVVHVGHSFGSTHTYALTAMYPNISDGIALTGFSQNGSFVPFFQLGGNFIDVKENEALASEYDHGYIASGNPSAVQTNFFAPGSFDPEILDFAANNGQPVSLGELLTIGGETASPNGFHGPVIVVTGERDVPFCGGSCYNGAPEGSSIPAQAQKTFTDTKISTVIIPGAGHGLNLEYSHPETYKAINDFFAHKC